MFGVDTNEVQPWNIPWQWLKPLANEPNVIEGADVKAEQSLNIFEHTTSFQLVVCVAVMPLAFTNEEQPRNISWNELASLEAIVKPILPLVPTLVVVDVHC